MNPSSVISIPGVPKLLFAMKMGHYWTQSSSPLVVESINFPNVNLVGDFNGFENLDVGEGSFDFKMLVPSDKNLKSVLKH